MCFYPFLIMAEQIKPRYFFGNPKYADLFEGCNYVWEALPKIPEYIKKRLGDVDVQVGEGSVVGEKATINGPVIIGKNCKINDYAIINGPTIIGDNCIIGCGATIWGNVFIGDNCIMRSELTRCFIMDNTNACHLSYIGDSIVGDNVNFGAGSILSNLKHDLNNVKIKFGEEVYDTGVHKFGAILGDGVRLGCNTVASPGTLVGKETLTYTNVNLRGVYESNKIVKLRQTHEIVEKR